MMALLSECGFPHRRSSSVVGGIITKAKYVLFFTNYTPRVLLQFDVICDNPTAAWWSL